MTQRLNIRLTGLSAFDWNITEIKYLIEFSIKLLHKLNVGTTAKNTIKDLKKKNTKQNSNLGKLYNRGMMGYINMKPVVAMTSRQNEFPDFVILCSIFDILPSR